MAALILVLGDQLTESLSAIRDANKGEDTILMAEVQEEATYVKHHKKKIAFLFSAMRHFAAHLSALELNVNYIKLNDESNQGSLLEQVKYTLKQRSYDKVICTMPGEYRLLKSMQQWKTYLVYQSQFCLILGFFLRLKNLANGQRAENSCVWSFSTARCVVSTTY